MTTVQRATMRGAALLLALAPVAACAQPGGQPTTNKPAAAAKAMSLQQFTSRHESKMLAADIDGDGKVSRAEFMAATRADSGDPAQRFARLDANGDGMLEKSEIDAMLARRFNKLDADGDGVASVAERGAARARGAKVAGKDGVS